MHEFTLMSQVFQHIVQTADEREAVLVCSVTLEIGSLTHLGKDQLEFCFDVLRGNDPRTAQCELVVEQKDTILRCPSCGGEKRIPAFTQGDDPLELLTFSCPPCNVRYEVLQGQEFAIKRIVMEIPEKMDENSIAQGGNNA